MGRMNAHCGSVHCTRDASLQPSASFVSRPLRHTPKHLHLRRRSRWLAWGVGAGVLYIVSALWTERGGLPLRILYDGFAPPPPYRWVRPPAGLAAENQPPEAGAGSISLRGGSEYAAVGTGDGQAFVIFPPEAIAASRGESAATITLTPLDPATIGPAPDGMRVDGNPYRIAARYATSQRPVVLRKPVTVILRYPTTGTWVLRSTDSGWIGLPSTNVHMGMQNVAESDRLGVFASAGPARGALLVFSGGLPRGLLVALWAALGVALLIMLKIAVQARARRTGPRR